MAGTKGYIDYLKKERQCLGACGEILPFSEFGKRTKPPHHPNSACKKCHSLYAKTKNKEKRMAMFPWLYYQCEECCFIVSKNKVKDNKCPECGREYGGIK